MNTAKSFGKDLPPAQDYRYKLEQSVDKQQITNLEVASNKQDKHSLSEQVEELRQQIEKLSIR